MDIHEGYKRLANLEGQRDALLAGVTRNRLEEKEKLAEAETLCGAAMLLIEMQKMLSLASSEKTERLLTLGLCSTFDNQSPFKVILENTRRRGVTNLDIFIEQDGHRSTDNYGGGILAVVSLLLQAVVIVRAGMQRLILIDEKLVHVSPEYRSQVMRLLRKLCDESGFNIMMTTNQQDFIDPDDNDIKADVILSLDKKQEKMVVLKKIEKKKSDEETTE